MRIQCDNNNKEADGNGSRGGRKMRIQCDVCETGAASVMCCADEAALCAECDVNVHAANKVAGKHRRLPLHNASSHYLPRCDICQEKPAFIFCVEDRALLCGRCDEPIHSPSTLAAKHHRFLATGITITPQTPNRTSAPPALEMPTPSSASDRWRADDLCLPLSNKGECASFGEFDWNMMPEMEPLSIRGFHEPAQVPELPSPLPMKPGESEDLFLVPDIEAQLMVGQQAPPSPPKRRRASTAVLHI